MRRYFLGVFAVIVLVILVVVLSSHGSNKPPAPHVAASLPSYASSSAVVRLTIVGPVVAQSAHNELQITVGNSSATEEVMQGYNDDVIRSISYPNTQTAYSVFLYALAYAGFTEGNTANDLKNNTGLCSTGDQYIFELIENGQDIERYWTTNCGGPHSFEGSLNLNLTLFQRQIPAYNKLLQNINL